MLRDARARISLEILGVAPCQQRLSRKMAAPALAPTSVEYFIHGGSSAGLGVGCVEVCDPAIWRIGPFSHVRSHIRKLMVTSGGVISTISFCVVNELLLCRVPL